MKVGAIESEIGRRAEVRAEEIGVGEDAGEDNREYGGAVEARESGALQGIRGQGVGEGIHTAEVIS